MSYWYLNLGNQGIGSTHPEMLELLENCQKSIWETIKWSITSLSAVWFWRTSMPCQTAVSLEQFAYSLSGHQKSSLHIARAAFITALPLPQCCWRKEVKLDASSCRKKRKQTPADREVLTNSHQEGPGMASSSEKQQKAERNLLTVCLQILKTGNQERSTNQ